MHRRAVVFDVMGTLFDLTALRPLVEAEGAPPEALEAWFSRTLHSAASLTLAGEFRPFSEIAQLALETTFRQLGLQPDGAEKIVAALSRVPAYPDASAALDLLEEAELEVAVLTNGGLEQTRELLERSGLGESVGAIFTTEAVGAYKPHRAVYEHALEGLGLPGESVTLVAAHGWDCVGARAAGLEAVWVDRLEQMWPLPVPEVLRVPGLTEAAELLAATERQPAK
jgi:2-haloacid dehalogenase